MIPETLEEKSKSLIRTHEGWSSTVYQCPSGRLTIGYGRNLEDKGITRTEGEILLDHDVREVYAQLTVALLHMGITLQQLPQDAQVVLIDMAYNLGISGLLKFKRMLRAIADRDWERVALEMQNSKWYHQVGKRSKHLMELIRGIK